MIWSPALDCVHIFFGQKSLKFSLVSGQLITGVQRLFKYPTTQQHKLLNKKQYSRRKIYFFNGKFSLLFSL